MGRNAYHIEPSLVVQMEQVHFNKIEVIQIIPVRVLLIASRTSGILANKFDPIKNIQFPVQLQFRRVPMIRAYASVRLASKGAISASHVSEILFVNLLHIYERTHKNYVSIFFHVEAAKR